ncbi:acetyltransferase [Arthroderma uncinatum]|uniref:acetyltransferase n=1 Tax=Arthroderma uncinatum TaxID=74035 RepID=UPI00144AD874|nr:acetyltransferase [Arthroderma uncinatum]KAF3480280.1 acetyltransferase [Arthroderma uncinatum]
MEAGEGLTPYKERRDLVEDIDDFSCSLSLVVLGSHVRSYNEDEDEDEENEQLESPQHRGEMAESPLVIGDIHALGQNEATATIEAISRIERRTFPTSEAMQFDVSLWRKKPNTRVIYGKTTMAAAAATSMTSKVIAYAVYVRVKEKALLHKICVEGGHRGQGLGRQMMVYIEDRLRREGCQAVHLWVDAARTPARRLYSSRGFEETETVDDYYGRDRTGIKMVLDLTR